MKHMENNTVPLLLPYDPAEFWGRIRQIIQEELHKMQEPVAVQEEAGVLLQRKEVAQRLRISLVTLNDWVKRGLPSYKQRGKVYFIYSEVLELYAPVKLTTCRRFKLTRSGRVKLTTCGRTKLTI